MFNRNNLIILVVALAGAVGLLAGYNVFFKQDRMPAGRDMNVVRLYPQARELPPFTLQQTDGTPLMQGELNGHWTLVFIGFTFCPDICPTTLAQLAQAQTQWEALPESTRPRVLFVSVDPERDTLDRLGNYAHAFHPDTLAATADIPSLEAFARSISMVFAKVPLGNGPNQYTVDHTAAIALLDPQGRMAGVIPGSAVERPDAIATDLIALTNASRQ